MKPWAKFQQGFFTLYFTHMHVQSCLLCSYPCLVFSYMCIESKSSQECHYTMALCCLKKKKRQNNSLEKVKCLVWGHAVFSGNQHYCEPENPLDFISFTIHFTVKLQPSSESSLAIQMTEDPTDLWFSCVWGNVYSPGPMESRKTIPRVLYLPLYK